MQNLWNLMLSFTCIAQGQRRIGFDLHEQDNGSLLLMIRTADGDLGVLSACCSQTEAVKHK